MTDSERIAELEKQIIELRQLVSDLQARPVWVHFVHDYLAPPYKITCGTGDPIPNPMRTTC